MDRWLSVVFLLSRCCANAVLMLSYSMLCNDIATANAPASAMLCSSDAAAKANANADAVLYYACMLSRL